MVSMAAKEETAIFFFLALFLCSSMVCEASQQYSYFRFVLQWPPSVCSNLTVSCATGYEKRFTIGGLRPHRIVPSCSGPAFNMSNIEYLRPKLNKAWYDFMFDTDVNNPNLWRQAWDRHGVCSWSKFNQTSYFQLALNMKNNRAYDVLHMLQAAGISPRESNPLWGRDRFYNAIYSGLGKEPILRCNINKFTRRFQLVQVILCFADDGIQLINCPHYMNNCPPSFTWPTTDGPPPRSAKFSAISYE